MAKAKTVYFCTECGNETIKWQGQCSACGAWNTIVEAPAANASAKHPMPSRKPYSSAAKLNEIDISDSEIRFFTGLKELDRVLGGGAVVGSVVLVGGEPGIGKSTLLLQLCGNLTASEHGGTVLYVSGEESERQLKLRADRLNVSGSNLYILAESNLSEIINQYNALSSDVIIIDSIQTLYDDEIDNAPGSVTQVKDCAMKLTRLAKSEGATVFIVGHVNKEGSIAGPKVLEHMVDCVLYFEGERTAGYRLLRAAKNRFGSANEIGVFEMTGTGLADVPNPSETLLSGRPQNAAGSCVTCLMEGSRPLLAEIQALASPTNSSNPRRTFSGIDWNRAALLLAVLEKRGALRLGANDVFINAVGGITADEPAADLAVILALASSYLDRPLGDDLIAIGEVGLAGELRGNNDMERRLTEAARLGFKRAVIPARGKGKLQPPKDIRLIEVNTVREAIGAVLGSGGNS
jgi:DNA repair protein RadA/Sms